MRRTLFAATLALTVVACSGSPRDAVPPAAARPPAGDASAAKPTPRYPRLDGVLNAVLASDRPLELAVERGLRVQEEHIQVTITTDPAAVDELTAWLAAQGARNLSSAGGEVQTDVPVELLRALDGRPEVRSVRRPSAIRDPGVR